jgi:phage tail-like protein
METSQGGPALHMESTAPVQVAHIADRAHHYPGETVLYYTRLSVERLQPGVTLRISIPAALRLESHNVTPELPDTALHTEDRNGIQTLIWSVSSQLEPGMRIEHQVQARVAPLEQGELFESRAQVIGEEGQVLSEEGAVVIVETKGSYLPYLPGIYHQDDLMGRFLMLFVSFWAPIEMQIGGIASHFDPELAPSATLPWLASWVGASVDERLPEERQRHLIRSALSLYRRRGTKGALEEFLEIYSGGQVRIVEHRAADLRLGPDSRLGQAIALGTGNRPHTFSVQVWLPRTGWLAGSGWGKKQADHARQLLASIIEAEKPAHTGYRLQIELVDKGEIE